MSGYKIFNLGYKECLNLNFADCNIAECKCNNLSGYNGVQVYLEFIFENRARAPKISQAGGSPLGGPRSEIGGGWRTRVGVIV